MVDRIDIHGLTLEELSGVIALYPWYAGARMELCRRMSEMGALSGTQVADTALHLEARELLAALPGAGSQAQAAVQDAGALADRFIAPPEDKEKPRIYVVGGDFFSQSQYEGVRGDSEGIFSRFAAQARKEGYGSGAAAADEDPYTETLARIYLEQGYEDEAKDIYSKLSLRYPEKSVYFASLIEKLD